MDKIHAVFVQVELGFILESIFPTLEAAQRRANILHTTLEVQVAVSMFKVNTEFYDVLRLAAKGFDERAALEAEVVSAGVQKYSEGDISTGDPAEELPHKRKAAFH